MTIEEALEKTTIVIPIRDAYEYIEALISCLLDTEAYNSEVIFVNDDSTDPRIKPLLLDACSKLPRGQYLHNNLNLLWSRSTNRGLRAASQESEFLCQINSDVTFKKEAITTLLYPLMMHPEIGVIGYPDGRPGNGPDEVMGITSRDIFGTPTGGGYISGHFMIYRRSVLDEVGLFCETDLQQAHICSERIHCWKLMDAGYKAVYVCRDLIVHDAGGASWKRDFSYLSPDKVPYHKWAKGRDTF